MKREKGGFWIGFCAVFFYPMGWLAGRVHYEGKQYLPPTGGAIVVANHISHLDPVVTGLMVHRARRVPRFLAKDSLWRKPVLGTIMRGTGQIPVHRDTADAQQSLRTGIAELQRGKVVVIYPEGTITRDPAGWPMEARTGVARMALATDVPVIPCAHWGTRDVYDGYNKKFRPLPRKDITVRFGPPIDLSEYRGKPVDGELLREVTDMIMTRVRDLVAEVRGEPAPAEFFRRSAS
ncbi:lysophospholipid acyltransferase family protein [Pseudonocardia thermophila]|uniref:lysophospholipid acyltransferase family protein n=1 Tax=Pseudonocardia thermophila TaxID=1848 RepID=UPI00190EEA3C|nr:lysophospholipid acyltransferase family protein [Pseudonocardia thermophila]